MCVFSSRGLPPQTLSSLRAANGRLLGVIEQRERAYDEEVAVLRARVASLQADCAARIQGLADSGASVDVRRT